MEVRALPRNLPDREPIRTWIGPNSILDEDELVNPKRDGISGYCQYFSGKGYDIYYSVCAHSREDGTKATVQYMPGVWVDVDKVDDKARDAIRSFPLKPTVVVSSGRGLHLYWLFPEPLQVEKESFLYLEILLKLICFRCRGDLATCDLSRILRLPGTVNQKNQKPVKVIRLNGERYTIWQIMEALF